MPKQKRFKTSYTGVFYIVSRRFVNGCYRRRENAINVAI